MNSKIIILFSCLVYSSYSQSIPMQKVEVNNDDPFNRSPESYVNFILDVTIDNDVFRMAMDTASDLVIVSNCTTHYCPTKANKTIPFNPKNTTVGNGVSGNEANLNVTIGNGKVLLDVWNADFVSKDIGMKLARKQVNGVLGFQSALVNLSRPDNVISFTTKPPVLFTGLPDTSITKQNVSNTPRSIIKLISPSELKFNINYIRNSMGGWKTWCFQGCTGIIDIMLNGIAGPEKDVNSINEYIGAEEDGSIECYKAKYLEPIHFYIGFNRYALKASNYIIKSKDNVTWKCRSAFIVNEDQNADWRFGVPMLDQYLTIIIDSKQVSFMELK